MQFSYGHPKRFATQAVLYRALVTAGVSLTIAFRIAFRVFSKPVVFVGYIAPLSAVIGVIAAILLFVFDVVAGPKLTGDDERTITVLQPIFVPGDHPVHSAPTERTRFLDGQLCETRIEVKRPEDADRCLDRHGDPFPTSVEARAWAHPIDDRRVDCCAAIIPGSEAQPTASFRRFFARLARLFETSPVGVPWLSAIAVFGGIAYAVGLIALLVLVVALLVLSTSGAELAVAMARLLGVVRRTRRLTSAHPWDDEGDKEAGTTILVQVSDIHHSKTTPYELRVDPGEFSGLLDDVSEARLDDRFRSVIDYALRRQPRVLALTGDIADTGQKHELDAALTTLRSCIASHRPESCVALPGNHDLTFTTVEEPDPLCVHLSERMEAFEAFRIQVESLGRIPTSTLGTLKPARRRPSPLEWLYGIAYPKGKATPTTISGVRFQQLPLFVTDDCNLTIATLNSCVYRSRFILSNAIGAIGEQQLQQLSKLLLDTTGPLILLMHHHLTVPHDRLSWRRPVTSVRQLMTLPVDADRLVALLLRHAEHGRRILVLHGHAHERMRYAIQSKSGARILVHGMPSSTMGWSKASHQRAQLDGNLYATIVRYDHTRGFDVRLKRPQLPRHLRRQGPLTPTPAPAAQDVQ